MEQFPEEVSRADRERAIENREMTVVLSYIKQQAASAFIIHVIETVLFVNIFGKGLTQEINGDEGSIRCASAHALISASSFVVIF